MRKIKTIEFFAGTKSFSNVMLGHGHSTFTLDNDASLCPDKVADIRTVNSDFLFPHRNPDFLWASPPCQGFSVAAIGHNWMGGYRGYVPKSDSARLSIQLVEHTIRVIKELKPKWWFIENPRGVLRKLPIAREIEAMGGVRHTVSYCQYGDTRMKPTDIWTNAKWWNPRALCKNGAPCHEAAPRGSKTGTQGINGARDRGRIPAYLFEEILRDYEKYNK